MGWQGWELGWGWVMQHKERESGPIGSEIEDKRPRKAELMQWRVELNNRWSYSTRTCMFAIVQDLDRPSASTASTLLSRDPELWIGSVTYILHEIMLHRAYEKLDTVFPDITDQEFCAIHQAPFAPTPLPISPFFSMIRRKSLRNSDHKGPQRRIRHKGCLPITLSACTYAYAGAAAVSEARCITQYMLRTVILIPAHPLRSPLTSTSPRQLTRHCHSYATAGI